MAGQDLRHCKYSVRVVGTHGRWNQGGMGVREGPNVPIGLWGLWKLSFPLCHCSQRPLKGHESCMGTVVSEYFVLTAAHCFTVDDQEHSIKVSVGKDAANPSQA